MTVPISRGFATSAVVDDEASFNTPRTGAAIKGRLCPYIPPFGVQWTRNMNQSAEIRGTAMPNKPFIGNAMVKGPMTWGFWSKSIALILKYGLGTVVTTEFPQPATGGSDISAGGLLTIISGDGSYTFNTVQTAAAGDRVIYSKSGVIYTGYITTKTNSTTGTMSTLRDGLVVAPNIAGATVLYVCANKANATPGTVSITSGTATFSSAPATTESGQMLIYDGTTVAIVSAWTGALTATVKDSWGHTPPDVSTKVVDWLGKPSYFKHSITVSPIAQLPTFVLQRAFADLTSPVYETFTGCKIDKLDFNFGGDGELFLKTDVIGVYNAATQYDSAPYSLSGYKLQQFQVAAYLNDSLSNILETASLSISNGIAPVYLIGGVGKAGALPEGIRSVSGKLTGMFGDTNLQSACDGVTSQKLSFVIDSGAVDKCTITIPEVVLAPQGTPPIQNAAGVTQDYDLIGFNVDPASIVMTIEMVNQSVAL